MAFDPDWQKFIEQQMNMDYMKELKTFVDGRRGESRVFPEPSQIFYPLSCIPYDKVLVVILGQDPYPTAGHAHGLAFSSLSNATPYALKNIFDEIFNDVFEGNTGGINVFHHNNLTQWAQQGVLLWNCIATVEENAPLSHAGRGWEEFSKAMIQYLDMRPQKLVFMLWGAEARKYKQYIDSTRHLVLESDHPNAPRHKATAWFGNKHFSKANNFIKKNYFNTRPAINWSVQRDPTHVIPFI